VILRQFSGSAANMTKPWSKRCFVVLVCTRGLLSFPFLWVSAKATSGSNARSTQDEIYDGEIAAHVYLDRLDVLVERRFPIWLQHTHKGGGTTICRVFSSLNVTMSLTADSRTDNCNRYYWVDEAAGHDNVVVYRGFHSSEFTVLSNMLTADAGTGASAIFNENPMPQAMFQAVSRRGAPLPDVCQGHDPRLPWIVTTLFRDPIERHFSHVSALIAEVKEGHWRSPARKQTVLCIVKDPNVNATEELQFHSFFHAAYCVAQGSDSGERLDNYMTRMLLDRPQGNLMRRDFTEARQRLLCDIDVVLLTKELPNAWPIFDRLLHRPWPSTAERMEAPSLLHVRAGGRSVSQEEQAITEAQLRLLIKHFDMDYELYTVASKRFYAMLAAIGN